MKYSIDLSLMDAEKALCNNIANIGMTDLDLTDVARVNKVSDMSAINKEDLFKDISQCLYSQGIIDWEKAEKIINEKIDNYNPTDEVVKPIYWFDIDDARRIKKFADENKISYDEYSSALEVFCHDEARYRLSISEDERILSLNETDKQTLIQKATDALMENDSVWNEDIMDEIVNAVNEEINDYFIIEEGDE